MTRKALILPMILLTALLVWTAALPMQGFWGAHGESRRSETARQMIADNEWLVPHLNGTPFITKPPLAYWLIAGSMSLFGVSEFAARIPSLLACLLSLWMLLDLLQRRKATQAVLWRSGFVWITFPLVFGMGRMAELEALLMSCTMFGLWAWMRLVLHGARHRGWQSLIALALALGFMIKGPLIWIFLLPALIVGELVRVRNGQKTLLGASGWLLLLAIQLLIILPWFLAVLHRVPDAMDIWRRETLDRVGKEEFNVHREAWWYYLGALPGFLPWLLLLPLRDTRRSGLPAGAISALWTGFVAPILLLSMATSKRAHYLLSIAPALCLLLVLSPARPLRNRNPLLLLYHLPQWIALLVLLALPWAAWKGWGLPGLLTAIPLWGSSWWLLRSQLVRGHWLRGSFLLAVALFSAAWILLPQINDYRCPRPFYQAVRDTLAEEALLANWRNDRYSASFYLHRPVLQILNDEQLFQQQPRGGYLMAEENELRKFQLPTEEVLRRVFPDPFRPDHAHTWILVYWRPQP